MQARFEIVTVVNLQVISIELGRFLSFLVVSAVAMWISLLERDAVYFVPDIVVEKLVFLFLYRKAIGSNP